MKTKQMAALALAGLLPIAMLIAQEPGSMREMDPKTHREMMPKHAKMMEEQKRQDEELDKLLAEMNAASGEKRLDAAVKVINKLVEQRKAMHTKMATLLD